MIEYPKINSIFKRDAKGDFTSDYSQPEFEYLVSNKWIGTEKVDGMNIRIVWQKEKLSFKGRTDRAMLPNHLLTKLSSLFSEELLLSVFGKDDVCLYGEGFGDKIQKGNNYNLGGVDFALFDIKIRDYWLRRDDLILLAYKLNIAIVPEVFEGSLNEAVSLVASGFRSSWGFRQAEGLVLQPKIELRDRRGNRIITKVKVKDFYKGEPNSL